MVDPVRPLVNNGDQAMLSVFFSIWLIIQLVSPLKYFRIMIAFYFKFYSFLISLLKSLYDVCTTFCYYSKKNRHYHKISLKTCPTHTPL